MTRKKTSVILLLYVIFKYFFQIDMEGKMKKLLFLIGILSSGLYGASIDHIQTYSPDYLSNIYLTRKKTSVILLMYVIF